MSSLNLRSLNLSCNALKIISWTIHETVAFSVPGVSERKGRTLNHLPVKGLAVLDDVLKTDRPRLLQRGTRRLHYEYK